MKIFLPACYSLVKSKKRQIYSLPLDQFFIFPRYIKYSICGIYIFYIIDRSITKSMQFF